MHDTGGHVLTVLTVLKGSNRLHVLLSSGSLLFPVSDIVAGIEMLERATLACAIAIRCTRQYCDTR